MAVLTNAQTCVNLFVVHAPQVAMDVRVHVLKVVQRHVLEIVADNVFLHVISNVKMDAILHAKQHAVANVIRDAQERAKTLQMLLLHILRYLVQIALLYAILVARRVVLEHVEETAKIHPLLMGTIQCPHKQRKPLVEL